ncbi:MAG: DUF4493 domain-containing protein [Alistipes sp.]
MKRLFNLTAVFAMAFILATGCISEDTYYNNPDKPDLTTVGYLSFGASQLDVATDTEIVRSAQASTPDVNTFTVEILDALNQTVQSFKYGERPTAPIELPAGFYTLRASSASIPEVGWENPVYVGTQDFSITKSTTTQLANTLCKLANIKVTVGYSADLAAELQAGSETSITIAPNTLLFAKEESRAGYFKATATTNTMLIHVSMVINGVKKQLETQVEGVKAGQWRKITINKEHTGEGTISFTITIETLTLDEEVIVDVATFPEEGLPEDEQPTIVWEGHNIGVQTQLTKTMFDNTGAYIGPFTIAVTTPKSTITAFPIELTSTNAELSAALTQAGMAGVIDLCAPSAAAETMLIAMGFPIKDQVRGQASVSFDLAAKMNLFYAYDGTHKIKLTVTNAAKKSTTQTLSLLVDKAGEAVTGPGIVWVGHNIKNAYEVTADLQVLIKVTAESGVAKFLVDIDSDVLTPDVLLSVGLNSHLDLINPGELEPMLGKDGLGFPLKDEVRNQKLVSFDITKFMELILGLNSNGYFNFKLTVTDNAGNTSIETIQLNVTSF